MTLMYSMLMMMFISNLIMLIAMILSKKFFHDREMNSPFECGFDPMSSSRIPFSLRFFLICIIFLIFDVEIVLIMPIIPIMKLSNISYWTLSILFFILILIMGLIHEWNFGALEWAK